MRKFWRGIAIFFLGGIFGTGFGIAVGFFIFPYVFPPPPAMEQLTQADVATSAPIATPSTEPSAVPSAAPAVAPKQAAAAAVATGTFVHANKSDPVHWGRGKVSVYERTVFLESDFEVGPGPAFHVYLVPNANVRNAAGVKDAKYVDLGGLRSFKGSQRYAVPAGVDLKNYPSVVIWCERFGVLISPADLSYTP